jgi:hypothetical protein
MVVDDLVIIIHPTLLPGMWVAERQDWREPPRGSPGVFVLADGDGGLHQLLRRVHHLLHRLPGGVLPRGVLCVPAVRGRGSVHVELFSGHLVGQHKLLILANRVTGLLILTNQV